MAAPVFLRDFVPYSEYLSMMRHPLPPYDTNALSATNNLRAHLRNCHGFRVQRLGAGNPYYIYQEVSKEWYQSLARPSDTQDTPDPPSASSPKSESSPPESEHQSAASDQNWSEDSPGPDNPPPRAGFSKSDFHGRDASPRS
ncbi:hypothetical protein N7528_002764 [Penicillium herquei]|nr:hypothetical protein N7528_002764 [Penicillium herquei]